TTPECVNVLLRGKAPHVKVKFGNKQATVGQIVGLKYNDVNGNATYDEGELGLADWTINITGITDPTYSNTTQTDSEGRFSFTNLPLGRYNVCEELKTGYANTTPLCFERELTNEVLSLRAVFGNKVVTEEILGQVVGIKFNDVNGNGELDDTELGLSGWKITINGVTDPTFEDEATTGTDGRYSFTNLPLGVYEICEVPQS